MSKQSNQMKWILFWVFLILFILMVLGTLSMVFFGFGSPTDSERELMVKGLIIEVAASVIALFYSIFGIKGQGSENQKVEDLSSEVINLKSMVEEKILDGEPKLSELSSTSSNYSTSNSDSSSFKNLVDAFDVAPPLPVDKYNLKPLPSDIKSEIRSAKPFDQKHRKESYRDMSFQWKVAFYSIEELDNERYRITAEADDGVLSVYFDISKEQGQMFRYIDRETVFWVAGKIKNADALIINLEDVVVKFE